MYDAEVRLDCPYADKSRKLFSLMLIIELFERYFRKETPFLLKEL